MKKIEPFLKQLEKNVNQSWYPIALGFIALIDYFIFVVPMVPLMVTSVFASQKGWLRLSLLTALGSSLGAILFALSVHYFGVSLLQSVAPQILVSTVWQEGEIWISKYGFGALFAFSVLPLSDHPIIAIAALTRLPMLGIGVVVIVAKLIKFVGFGWMASHTPRLLKKFTKIKPL